MPSTAPTGPPSTSPSPSGPATDVPVICQDPDLETATLGSCAQGDLELEQYVCRDPETGQLMRLDLGTDDAAAGEQDASDGTDEAESSSPTPEAEDDAHVDSDDAPAEPPICSYD